MTTGEAKKQSKLNSGTNLSHTLERKRIKQINNHTVTQDYTAAKIKLAQQKICKPVQLKKPRTKPAATRVSTKPHPRKLLDQKNPPAY